MNLANSITLARFPLLILLVWMLYTGGAWGRFLAVPGIVLLIGMDAFDGIVARRRNETSLLGSVLDIAADRAVEAGVSGAHARLGARAQCRADGADRPGRAESRL